MFATRPREDTETTVNPAPSTIARLTKRGWKALAKLDDPEDAEALRSLLVETLEALDAMEESTD